MKANKIIPATVLLSAALAGCGGKPAANEIVSGVALVDSKSLLGDVKISNCETSYPLASISSSIECVFTYSGTGQVVPNFYGAVAYDKDGVRLGIASFPDQNLLPNQPVRSGLHFSPVAVSDIAKIVIAVNVGGGYVESK